MKKFTINYVRESFENEGYELLDTEYKDTKSKLKYTCPNGHKHQICFSEWRKGQRCLYCARDNLRLKYEYVKQVIESEGYILISEDYINSRSKLNIICPEGHKTTTTYSNWKNGCRCGHCANNVRYTLNFVKKQFEKEGYILLSDFYINQKQKLKYKCFYGHEHSITFTDWYNGGYRCPTCYAIKISGPGNYGWNGGSSNEDYCGVWRDKEYKQDIRNRDGNICLNPYCYSKHPEDLTIHHIDYDKKNCSPKNLITICRACNNRANHDRVWHKLWYRIIMNKRYNYNYERN
jgi:hypothetical protein